MLSCISRITINPKNIEVLGLDHIMQPKAKY